jgi:hypothetical protein
VNTTTWRKIGELDPKKSIISCDSSGFYHHSGGNLRYFNLSSNSFELLDSGPKFNSSCMIRISQNLWLLNESSEIKEINYLKFDPSSKAWSSHNISLKIHSFSCTSSKNSLYLFGGYQKSGLSNELIEYYEKNSSFTTLSSNLTYPPRRSFGTLTSFLGYHYLIGGENNGELFNDVWRTKVQSLQWEQIDYSGDFIKLTHHATSIYANTVLIFGGKGVEGLSKSLFQLTFDGKFSEINVDGDRPTARQGACMVSNDSLVFIFGGETRTGLSGELWKFDIGALMFSLISTYEVGIAFHTCDLKDNFLQAIYGRTSTGEYNDFIISVDLYSSLVIWKAVGPLTNPASSAITALFHQNVIKYGGEFYGSGLKSGEVLDLSTFELKTRILSSIGLIGSAYTVFNKSILTFGGKTSTLGFESSSSSCLSYLIGIDELFCNRGMQKVGNSCKECPSGTYSDKVDSSSCTKCPKGTYNSNPLSHSYLFCMPCPYNTFGSEEGLSSCYSCPSFSYCPVGASEPQILYTESSVTSINPELSTSSSAVDSLSFNIEMIFLAVGIAIILAFLSSRTLRRLVKKTDIFKQNHNETIDSPMILRKTEIGGCYTILFVVAAICLSIITLIYFFLDNKSISQALVPLASILNEYPDIEGDMSFKIFLKNFGGICPKPDSCSEALTTTDIFYSSKSVICEEAKDVCSLTLKCSKCRLGAFPHLKMNLRQTRCFASSIDLNITSDSGIDNQKSSVLVKVKPSEQQVLIGPKTSLVNIDVIYSVYEDTHSLTTGYYVLSSTEPEVGSTFLPSEVPFYNQLLVDVVLNKQTSALLTLVTLKQATELIFTGLLGGITGILQIFSYLMDSTESVYNKVSHKMKSREKVIHVSEKTDLIRNNFDWKSVLATKHTLWLTDSASLTVNNEVTVEDY